MIKKVLLILSVLILLAVACLYIFIPGKITITKSLKVAANRDALFRKLATGNLWKEWWPANEKASDTPVVYLLNGMKFKPGPPRALSVPMSIEAPGFVSAAEFTFLVHNIDSTTIDIETSIPVSYNPFKRIGIYAGSKKLEKSLSEILQSLNNTYSKIANLYDYNIQKKLVVDSILVSTFEETKGYPSVSKIYELIDELKDYTKKNAAIETGFPMLNIYTPDGANYTVRVAIPVNKKLLTAGNISYKWMLGGGNILITEVKGGPYEINKAYKQILNYISDHSRTAPAISFESLVTDRRKEPDSSKWITRIYYPVM